MIILPVLFEIYDLYLSFVISLFACLQFYIDYNSQKVWSSNICCYAVYNISAFLKQINHDILVIVIVVQESSAHPSLSDH